jgi:hypothetical protein
MKKFSFYIFVLFLIILTNLNAQDSLMTGTISGVVTDKETHQPLPGATIIILNTKTGKISDSHGNYTIENVPIGRYILQARFLGYEPLTLNDIIVVTKRTTFANFELVLSSLKMQEITVKSDLFNKSNEENSLSTTQINLQEIRMTPGTPDLFRRLQFIAGVGGTGESSSAMIVRGGDPEENLTLIENIEVFSPFHFSNLSGELVGSMSIIEPKLVDNVEISTGGFGAIYGDKMSSVTQITLREPEKRRVNGDFSMDLSGLSAFSSGPLGSKVSWLFSARRGLLDLVMKMMDLKFIPVTTDFHSKVVIEPNMENKITIYGLYAADNMSGSHSDEVMNEKEIFSDIRKSQSVIGLNWRWLFSEKGYLLLTPYINNNDWQLTDGTENKKDANGDRNKENIFGSKVELFYRFNSQSRISLGAEYKNITANYGKWHDYDTLTDGTLIEPYQIDFEPGNSYKFTSFLQYLYKPMDWMNFNIGIREEYFKFINEFTIDPRISANFIINDRINLNMAWGIFSQFPQFYRIFQDSKNMELKPSKAVHYIAGIEYLLSDDMQLKLEGYYKDLSSLSVRENDTSRIFRSTGKGYSYGIESTLTKKMSDDLYVLLNYTYSVSRRKDFENTEFYDFKYDRPHTINLMTTYKLSDWWEFGLTAAFATGFPFTPFDLSTLKDVNGVWYCSEGDKNSERFPDYFRVDLRVDRRFIFESWNLRLYAELWNITNHSNVFEYTYTNNFSERKTEVLFPFMPIIGISAEF